MAESIEQRRARHRGYYQKNRARYLEYNKTYRTKKQVEETIEKDKELQVNEEVFVKSISDMISESIAPRPVKPKRTRAEYMRDYRKEKKFRKQMEDENPDSRTKESETSWIPEDL